MIIILLMRIMIIKIITNNWAAHARARLVYE